MTEFKIEFDYNGGELTTTQTVDGKPHIRGSRPFVDDFFCRELFYAVRSIETTKGPDISWETTLNI